jgi:sterol desaturase/sphingolipid hydroxylase (fatty acid hydroxylase superfamily)
LPGWWTRFTEENPTLPSLVAVTGLSLICFSLAQIISSSEHSGQGQIIETFGSVSQSKPFFEKAMTLRSAYHKLFPPEIRNLLYNLYGNITLYLIVPFLLMLEFLFPSNPSQPLIGKGFLQDSIWYLLDTPLNILILYPIIGFLHGVFIQHMGFLTLDPAMAWPAFIQILAALLLAEFFIWFNHYVRHKIHSLWLFHAVHHSQKELNIFTDDRAHIVDLVVGQLFTFIPFFIFDVSNLYVVAVIAIYKPIHNRFIHANLKINLGWLGRIFTSPQFHRIHHSAEPEHADKNFGVYFSIFDHLFGTACADRNVYPQTGITDSRFPTEDKVRISQLPKNWLLQVVYPFTQLFEKLMALGRLFHFRLRTQLRNNNEQSKLNQVSPQEEPRSL